jgi:hypothetical protein
VILFHSNNLGRFLPEAERVTPLSCFILCPINYLKESVMTDNTFLACCLTLCSCVALGYGFDTDGYYLRQALLVFAGYTIAGVFFLIFTGE